MQFNGMRDKVSQLNHDELRDFADYLVIVIMGISDNEDIFQMRSGLPPVGAWDDEARSFTFHSINEYVDLVSDYRTNTRPNLLRGVLESSRQSAFHGSFCRRLS